MFSQNLKRLRETSDISQTRFSQEIGFSQAAISAWENNTREPGIAALIKIAQYFNVSVDFLIGSSSQDDEMKIAPDERKLLEIFRKLTLKNKMHVSAYATVRLEEQERGTRSNIG